MRQNSPRHVRPRLLRVLLGIGLVLAVLAVLHAVLWRQMADRLEAGFGDWAAARRAQGWELEHAAPGHGGWPLAATLTLPSLRLRGGEATVPGGVDWRAEQAVLRVALPRLDRLTVALGGRLSLRLGGVELPFAADRLDLTLPIEPGVLPRAGEFTAERLRVGTPAGAIEARRLSGEIATMRTAVEGEEAVAVRVSAGELKLPGGLAPGSPVERLEVTLALTGPWPRGAQPAARAAAWRDGGGTLHVQELLVTWGAATATGEATLALDESLQPMGAGVLRVVGAAAALDSAVAARLVPASGVAAARLVLALLEREPAGGGPAMVELPFTLEERVLTVARVPVLRVPAWAWPRDALE